MATGPLCRKRKLSVSLVAVTMMWPFSTLPKSHGLAPIGRHPKIRRNLGVLIPEVVDAAGGWAVDGGVISVVIVFVEPPGEGFGSLVI